MVVVSFAPLPFYHSPWCVGLTVGLGAMENDKFSCPFQESNTNSSLQLYRLSYGAVYCLFNGAVNNSKLYVVKLYDD
jgi:hypothetical protein